MKMRMLEIKNILDIFEDVDEFIFDIDVTKVHVTIVPTSWWLWN